jgi:carbonic anhydrase
MKRTRSFIGLIALASLIASQAAIPAYAQQSGHDQYVSPWKTPWTYEESDHWSSLDPAYALCNTGKQQSPIDIDIRNAETADLPALQFESRSMPLRYVINNRHTIRVDYDAGNGNFLLADGVRYELTQFHFHRPSEEQVDGKAYDMEVHLMYKSGDGKIAGVTVFVMPGSPNSTIGKIWEHMPQTEGQQRVDGMEISSGNLLPSDTAAYYEYVGSVTAPPCTEGVTWFVLKKAIEMSAGQIAAFARLYPHDARPIQPLNGRIVRQSR